MALSTRHLIPLLPAAAGGEDLTKSIDDGCVVTDAAAKAVTRAQADTGGATDQITPTSGFARAQDDSALVGDLATAEAEFVRAVDEAAAVSDAISPRAGKVMADSAALSDSWGVVVGKGLADGATVADFTAAEQNKALSDALTASDEVARVTTFTLTLDDAASLVDGLGVEEQNYLSQPDSATVTDEIELVVGFVRAPSDGLGAQDSLGKGASAGVEDALVAGEQFGGEVGFIRAVEDAAGLSDDFGVAGQDSTSITDSAQLGDSVLPGVDFVRSVGDGIEAADHAGVEISPRISDSAGISDHSARGAGSHQGDTAAATDSSARRPGVELGESIAISDGLNASGGESTSVSDSVGLTDQIELELAFVRALDDSVVGSDHLETSGTENWTLDLSDGVVATDAVGKSVAKTRAEAAFAADAIASALERASADTSAATDAIGLGAGKRVGDVLVGSDAVTLAYVREGSVPARLVLSATSVEVALSTSVLEAATLSTGPDVLVHVGSRAAAELGLSTLAPAVRLTSSSE